MQSPTYIVDISEAEAWDLDQGSRYQGANQINLPMGYQNSYHWESLLESFSDPWVLDPLGH
jgi:hypothetical protein